MAGNSPGQTGSLEGTYTLCELSLSYAGMVCCHREGRVCAKVLHLHEVPLGGEGTPDRANYCDTTEDK